MSLRDDLREIDQSTDWTGMKNLGRAIAPSIAPTVGAIGMTPLMGPWAGPVVGGLAGEAANNLMGLTQPSIGGYAAQALVPPAMRGGANLKRVFPAFGTSSKSAETLNQIGKQDIRLIQNQYQPLTSSDELFARVGNELIPMPHAKRSAEKVLERIERQMPSDRPLYEKSKRSAKDVAELFEPRLKPERPRLELPTYTEPYEPTKRYSSKELGSRTADELAKAAPGRYTSTGERTVIPPIVDKELQSSADIAMGKIPRVTRFFPDLPSQGELAGATAFPKRIDPAGSSPVYPETIAGALQEYLDTSTKNKLLADELKWEKGPGGLPAIRFQEAMKTQGERLRAARRGEESVGGSTNVQNYGQLFGGYARDLDASPLLKRARESFKREQVLEDIGESTSPFIKKGVGSAEQINVNALMNRLKDETDELGRFFHQAFTEQERREIINRLAKINKLPGIAPGTGQATGSSKVNPIIAAMLGGGAIGYGHGGPGEALGMAAGAYALSGAGRMARDLSIAWNIPAGRAMIQAMLDRSGGRVTPQMEAAIQAFAAAQTASLPKTLDIFKETR